MSILRKYYLVSIEFMKANKALSISALNVFLLLLALLIKDPFYFFVDSYAKSPPFFSLKESGIAKLIIQKTKVSGSDREIFRENDSWKLRSKAGKVYFADEGKITPLIKSILGAKKFTVVSSSSEKSFEFGFTEEEIRIEVFGNDSTSQGYFLVGSVTPRGNYTHIKFNDSPKIFLVEDNLKSVTGRGEENFFVNKRLSPAGIIVDDITEFSLRRAEPGYELRKENKEWILTAPISGKALENEVTSVLTKLQDLKADDILESSEKLKLETANPFTLGFSYKTKSGKNGSVSIVSIGKDKDYYYLKRNGDETIYKVSSYHLTSLLTKKPESFLNPGK